MKKYIFIVLLAGFLAGCGGSGNDVPEPIVENRIPTIPLLVDPIDNLLCTDNTVTFNWDASTDLDGDAINYTIQVSDNNQFSNIVHEIEVTSTSVTISLDKGTAYYWRVKATDTAGDSSEYSTTFQFYTEGEASENHSPFLPDLVAPTLGSVVGFNAANPNVLLQWTADDVDADDALTFDVYFGTENPPLQKVVGDLSETSFSVVIETSKTYYWKVKVKDSQGAQTIGNVWNFKTD